MGAKYTQVRYRVNTQTEHIVHKIGTTDFTAC